MKVLISDFDGTLFINGKISKYDIQKINEFRNKGNVFIISTARNFSTVKAKCIKFGIKVDYFFCDIGSTILTNDGVVLYKKFISYSEKNIIEEVLSKYEKLIEIKRYGVKTILDHSEKNIVEYKINGNIENLNEIKTYLDEKLRQAKIQITEDNKLVIHTGTKEKIIHNFIEQKCIKDINKSSIITIGDELDDLNMLKIYNGYRMNNCNPILKKKVNTSAKSVSKLIELIIR